MKTFENETATTYRPETGKLLKITETIHEIFPVADEEGNITEEEKVRTAVYFRTFLQVPKGRGEDFVVEEVPDPSVIALPDNIARLRDLGVELGEIKAWFAATDYIPNKVLVGEWEETDQRWIEYKQERAVKRARQDEILQEMKGGKK